MIRNIISQSLQSLSTNRLRSFLTMLGVVWGTASVVFLLGWGRGFVVVMDEELHSIGDGFVFFWPKKARSETSGRRGARWLRMQLKHVDAILDHCPSVRYITPSDGMYGTMLKQGARLKAANVFGVYVEAANIFKLDVERGRFLQPDDLKYNRRVIVLGFLG